MKNESIDKIKNTPEKQTQKGGIISRKSVGRPTAPNMQAITVRMDRSFHQEVIVYAKKLGVGKSALITAALKSYMEKGEKKYRLIEV